MRRKQGVDKKHPGNGTPGEPVGITIKCEIRSPEPSKIGDDIRHHFHRKVHYDSALFPDVVHEPQENRRRRYVRRNVGNAC